MAPTDSTLASVDISTIEDELTGLWKQQDESAGAVLRTVLLTLLAYCRNSDCAQRVSASVAAIAADHPARAIIVTDEAAETEPNIKAWVSVSCQLVNRSDKQHCSEQVFLQAHGADMGRIVSSVQPLALPDVPFVLWLADGAIPQSDVFGKLVQQSDRLLIESAVAEDALDLFRWVTDAMHEPGPSVVDLTWIGLESRRLAFAHQFDLEKWRSMLPEVDCVEITGACDNGKFSAETLLMAGWLVSRLQWYGYGVESHTHPGQTAPSHSRIVRLIPSASGQPVERVTLKAGSGMEVSVDYSADGTEAHVHAEAEEANEQRTVPMKKRSPERLLCGALEIVKQDSVYLDTVRTVMEILTEPAP